MKDKQQMEKEKECTRKRTRAMHVMTMDLHGRHSHQTMKWKWEMEQERDNMSMPCRNTVNRCLLDLITSSLTAQRDSFIRQYNICLLPLLVLRKPVARAGARVEEKVPWTKLQG